MVLAYAFYRFAKYVYNMDRIDEIEVQPQDLEVFDKNFLRKYREMARARYIKGLEEQKELELQKLERKEFMVEI